MLDRGGSLWLYQYQWPVFDAAFFALCLRWLILAVALAGVWWLVTALASRRRGENARGRPSAL
jgi:hypothetical protein